MGHFIGRIRKRARRTAKPGAGGSSGAVRAALQAGEVQAKLQVGPQNDAYEREADAVAARVVSNQPAGPVSTLASSGSQRKCAACTEEEEQAQAKLRADVQRQPEEEEEELQAKARDQVQRQAEEEEEEPQTKPRDHLQRQVEEEEEELQTKSRDQLQRQAEEEEEEEIQPKLRDRVQRQAEEEEEELQTKGRGTGFPAGPQATAQVAGLRGAGQPLGAGSRSFFESRFGADFSDVRVHTGPRAERAADALNARAFTTGRDVVFGAGEYAPTTRKGTELLAHELTHVIQQRGYRGRPEAPEPVQRWRVGAAVPAGTDWDTVPDGTPAGQPNHRRRLAAARRIVSSLLSSTRCQNYFENNCEGGSPTSLRESFNNARVYHMDVGGVRLGENMLGTPNIAYNNTAYTQGRFFLAATLLHEMYHVCAPTRAHNTRELLAENALEACRLYAPFLRRISPRSGPAGTTVTLTGWGLGPSQGSHDRVEFNGATCTVLSWSFNRSSSMVTIRVELPAGARTGHFRVFNNNVGSRPAAFTVT